MQFQIIFFWEILLQTSHLWGFLFSKNWHRFFNLFLFRWFHIPFYWKPYMSKCMFIQSNYCIWHSSLGLVGAITEVVIYGVEQKQGERAVAKIENCRSKYHISSYIALRYYFFTRSSVLGINGTQVLLEG